MRDTAKFIYPTIAASLENFLELKIESPAKRFILKEKSKRMKIAVSPLNTIR